VVSLDFTYFLRYDNIAVIAFVYNKWQGDGNPAKKAQ
jgi:hypothetical protein